MSKNCKILIVLIPILVGLSVFISCHPERVFSYGVRNMYHWMFGESVYVEYWEGDIQIWKQGHCKIHLVSDKTGYYDLQCFIKNIDINNNEIKKMHIIDGEFIVSVYDSLGDCLLERKYYRGEGFSTYSLDSFKVISFFGIKMPYMDKYRHVVIDIAVVSPDGRFEEYADKTKWVVTRYNDL